MQLKTSAKNTLKVVSSKKNARRRKASKKKGVAAKPVKVNYWKEHHENLNDRQKAIAKENVMSSCEFSSDTFYRKMRNPEKLKQWEKNLVAEGYGVDVNHFFPEA